MRRARPGLRGVCPTEAVDGEGGKAAELRVPCRASNPSTTQSVLCKCRTPGLPQPHALLSGGVGSQATATLCPHSAQGLGRWGSGFGDSWGQSPGWCDPGAGP